MELSKEQSVMLCDIWSILKSRLVKLIGKTRLKNENNFIEELNFIGNDTLKLFLDLRKEDANIALEFVTFVIFTIVETKSLQETIDKTYKVYDLPKDY